MLRVSSRHGNALKRDINNIYQAVLSLRFNAVRGA